MSDSHSALQCVEQSYVVNVPRCSYCHSYPCCCVSVQQMPAQQQQQQMPSMAALLREGGADGNQVTVNGGLACF